MMASQQVGREPNADEVERATKFVFGDGWNRFWYTPADAFTLSVLRVLSGMVALWTVLSFGPDLDRFFGPAGMLPVPLVKEVQETAFERHYRWSYLDYAQSSNTLWVLHWGSVAILAAYTLGLFTRVTSVLGLIAVLSYCHRGPLLTSQFEPILSFVMLYLCVGPSGTYLSLDRWLALRRAKSLPAYDAQAQRLLLPPPTSGANVATRLLQIHIAVVHFMMFLDQLYGDAWWNGLAAYWLSFNTRSALLDFTWLQSNSLVLLANAWTLGVVAYELAFAWLAWKPLARRILLPIGLLVWTSLALLTGLVSFCAMMVIASLAFVEPERMRRLCACCGAKSTF